MKVAYFFGLALTVSQSILAQSESSTCPFRLDPLAKVSSDCEDQFWSMRAWKIKTVKNGFIQCLTQNIEVEKYELQPGSYVAIPDYLNSEKPLYRTEPHTNVSVPVYGNIMTMTLEPCTANNLNQIFVPQLGTGGFVNVLLVLIVQHNMPFYNLGSDPYGKKFTFEISRFVWESANNASFNLVIPTTFGFKGDSTKNYQFYYGDEQIRIGDYKNLKLVD